MTRGVELDEGLVVAGHGRHYIVESPEGRRVECVPRGKKSECVVGDRVRWMATDAAGRAGVIEHVEPRRNLLMRRDEWKTKSFAANIDQLLVLVGVAPPFSESQLARALIAAESAGIPARIALNKTDLPDADAARTRLAPYRAMGAEVVEVALKAAPDAARATLRDVLADRATLVLGPSGAGKSTLINLLVPGAQVQTGEISQALNSGKHTTTATRWYWVDRTNGTALIDSPGFQEFGRHHIAPTQLAACMPDIAAHASDCRFYNCTHLHEPGCGVISAVENTDNADIISSNRYKIYSDLFAELSQTRY